MARLKARDEESMFYALVQKSIRQNRNSPFNIRLLSYLYGVFTNYGQSYLRPIVSLGVIFCLSIFIYGLLMSSTINWHNKIDWNIIGDSFDCALQQIKPFGFSNSKNLPFIKKMLNKHPFF
ncbi:MAG: hypothetical protein K0R12_436 [Gammaproteobacteria bacterium]|jgi:hypothetical protein|nr:hypothetical protein [Gammaproteobacteria bacterium]